MLKRYYAEKSIPQIKELLSHYGPLGIVWFDMPGGLSREETLAFIGQVRGLQPACLISSRVGRGLGDFRDFGDSELPPNVIAGRWVALFPQTDSWGYAKNDSNFKTPREVLRLLASTAARGGNLLLNVGPDGTGRISGHVPPLPARGRPVAGAQRYGQHLRHHPFAFSRPALGRRDAQAGAPLSPCLHPAGGRCVDRARFWRRRPPRRVARAGKRPSLGNQRRGSADQLFRRNCPMRATPWLRSRFSGTLTDGWTGAPALISRQYESFALDAAGARLRGRTEIKTLTHSGYFGNWKHDTCAVGLRGPDDAAEFPLRFLAAGDYRITLEYACPGRFPGSRRPGGARRAEAGFFGAC